MRDVPRILIPQPTSIDLSYNRECWPQYAEAVRAAGGAAVEASLTSGRQALFALAGTCEGVLLPGSLADVSPELYGHARVEACGLADTLREQCDLALLEHVFASRKPLLAICYGAQSLNVSQGGTLLQDLAYVPVNHAAGAGVGVAHGTAVLRGSMLGEIVAEAAGAEGLREGPLRLMINSSHHQAIGVPGQGLLVVARSTEDLVVEAIERTERSASFLLGVQWHPERTTAISAVSREVFVRFVQAAAHWRGSSELEVAV